MIDAKQARQITDMAIIVEQLHGRLSELVFDAAKDRLGFAYFQTSAANAPIVIEGLEARGYTVTDREPDEDGQCDLKISW